MRVIRYENRDEFAAAVTPFLMKSEAENCFFLGHVNSADLKPEIFKIAIVNDASEVVGVAMKWPDRHMVLSDMPPAAVDALVDHLLSAGVIMQGAQGRVASAQRFIDRYVGQTGAKPAVRVEMALQELRQVIPVRGVPGGMRVATGTDVDLLAGWIEAFCRDCGLPPPKGGERTRAQQRIERGEMFIWETDGRPVSTATLMGPTPNGIRISLVYTPTEFRGHGYASACVAALSQRMLDSGKRFCFLYSDLANPTSNKIYHAIGHEPVCDNLQILFEGHEGAHQMREEIDIPAPPPVVWPFVADPVRMVAWQPKVGSVTPITAGEPRIGARYRIIFRMNGREQPFTSTIEEFQPPVRIVLLHIGQKDRRVRETFDLAPNSAGGTNLRHEIDLSNSGIPWYWKPVIAFITRFGQPRGDGPLEHLKRHVESTMSPVSQAE